MLIVQKRQSKNQKIGVLQLVQVPTSSNKCHILLEDSNCKQRRFCIQGLSHGKPEASHLKHLKTGKQSVFICQSKSVQQCLTWFRHTSKDSERELRHFNPSCDCKMNQNEPTRHRNVDSNDRNVQLFLQSVCQWHLPRSTQCVTLLKRRLTTQQHNVISIHPRPRWIKITKHTKKLKTSKNVK